MATDPKDHPVHAVPDELPRPPGDLPPSSEPPGQPVPQAPVPAPQPGLASSGGPNPYSGEVENEAADPVGAPPRL